MLGTSDEDVGYPNWEEYNSIDPRITETNRNRSSPQFYVVRQPVTNQSVPQQWTAISHDASFGRFVTAEQYAWSGPTADPNDPDSDGDGMLDGVESSSPFGTQRFHLDPQSSRGRGWGLDSDADGLADRLELTLADAQPGERIHRRRTTVLRLCISQCPDEKDKSASLAELIERIEGPDVGVSKW